jgi:DNA-binding IclR family transcriptional regulator
VDRAARILDAIQAEGRPMRITELADQLEVSKGTVREILETLRMHGLLERNEETKRYRLGPKLLRLGASSRASLSLTTIARPYLQQLAETLSENVLMLVAKENDFLVQDACQPRDPRAMIVVAASPGHTIPLHAGACAKVLAAWGDPQQAKSTKISSRAAKAIRSTGYATDDQEYLEGVRAVAAPLLSLKDSSLLGIVLVSGIAASLRRDRLDSVGKAIHEACSQIVEDLDCAGVV